jgi:hypothetical protein
MGMPRMTATKELKRAVPILRNLRRVVSAVERLLSPG